MTDQKEKLEMTLNNFEAIKKSIFDEKVKRKFVTDLAKNGREQEIEDYFQQNTFGSLSKLEHFFKMDYWTYLEAIAILSGVDPDYLKDSEREIINHRDIRERLSLKGDVLPFFYRALSLHTPDPDLIRGDFFDDHEICLDPLEVQDFDNYSVEQYIIDIAMMRFEYTEKFSKILHLWNRSIGHSHEREYEISYVLKWASDKNIYLEWLPWVKAKGLYNQKIENPNLRSSAYFSEDKFDNEMLLRIIGGLTVLLSNNTKYKIGERPNVSAIHRAMISMDNHSILPQKSKFSDIAKEALKKFNQE